MKFSLLYKNYTEQTDNLEDPLIEEMSNALYDLSVDKAVKIFCPNKEGFVYFMDVLKRPLKSVGDIKYRQDILMDFIAMPKLLEDLKLIFKSYDSSSRTGMRCARPSIPTEFPIQCAVY